MTARTWCPDCPYAHDPGTGCPPGWADAFTRVRADGGDTAPGPDRVAFPSRNAVRHLAVALLVTWAVLFGIGALIGWLA